MRFRTSALGALAMGIACHAHAQVFFGYDASSTIRPQHDAAKAAFQAAISGAGQFDFESVPTGPLNGIQSFGNGVNGNFASSSASGISLAEVTTSGIYSTFAFSGTKYFVGHVDPARSMLTINFDREIHAIGFSLSDESDWGTNSSNPAHDLVLGNGERYSLTNGTPHSHTDGNSSFFGVVSAAGFRTISIEYPAGAIGTGLDADAVGIDDIVIGNAVPEPATLAAFAGLLALTKRRKGA